MATTTERRSTSATTFEVLCGRATEVAERLASDAVEREQRNEIPHAEVSLLREAGLLAALIPAQLGGAGLRWSQSMELVGQVARGDTAIGMLLGYHSLIVAMTREAARPDQANALGRASVAEGWYWGGVVNPLDPPVVLTRADGGGYRASGYKSFATGSTVADIYFVNASLDGIPRLVAVRATSPGVSVDRGTWDHLGVRLSETATVHFDEVAVAASDVLGPEQPPDGPPPARATLAVPLIQSMFASFYLGAARGALEDAAEYVRAAKRPWIYSGVERAAEDPYTIAQFGGLDSSLRAAEALTRAATTQLDGLLVPGFDVTERTRGEVAVTVSAAKIVAAQTALKITNDVFELQGARSTAKRHGFDRRWRDVRTHTLHDPVVYKAREVGDLLLNDRIPEPDLTGYR